MPSLPGSRLPDNVPAWIDLGEIVLAAGFINPEGGFADAPAVLDGVRDILSER